MARLIEADCSNNNLWYFYWLDADNTRVWLSKSSTAAAAGDIEGLVTVADDARNIRGISFDYITPNNRIMTHYGNGILDVSSNSLNLAQ